MPEADDWELTLDDRLVAPDGWYMPVREDLTDATEPELVRVARMNGWRG